MLYSDSICLWIVCVCVCVNTNYDYDAAFASLGNHLPAPSPGYNPGGSRSSLAVPGLLFLSSAAISSVSRVHHQAYFCGFPFFGGAGNIFFGLEFIYHAVHPFQEYSSVCLDIVTEVCHYHANQFYTVFIIPERNLIFHLPIPPQP